MNMGYSMLESKIFSEMKAYYKTWDFRADMRVQVPYSAFKIDKAIFDLKTESGFGIIENAICDYGGDCRLIAGVRLYRGFVFRKSNHRKDRGKYGKG
jgi:hypothetical protein